MRRTPGLGRWNGIDPLAENYHSTRKSPEINVPQGSLWFYNRSLHGSVENYLGMFGPIQFKIGGGGGGGDYGGLKATNVKELLNYFNANGYTADSIDFLFDNYKNGVVKWWTGGSELPDPSTGYDIDLGTQYVLRIEQNTGGNWYETGGRANWFFGVAATLGGVKGSLNAERMYAQGIRGGLAGNYALTGRNLSLFGKMPSTKASMPISSVGQWAGVAGKVSFGIAVVLDYSAYRNDKISGAKFTTNTTIGAYGLTSVGTIPSILYFGVDSFYPGGWIGNATNPGAIIDVSRMIEANQQIVPNFNIYRDYPSGW